MNILSPMLKTTARALWLLLLVLVLSSGCSGINVSKSVSPLDFLLPGLMRNDQPAPVIPDSTNSMFCWHGLPTTPVAEYAGTPAPFASAPGRCP